MEDYIADRIANTALSEIFKNEQIASVIRRPARAFGGKTALDLIKEGRIAEVKRLYEQGLTYQG